MAAPAAAGESHAPADSGQAAIQQVAAHSCALPAQSLCALNERASRARRHDNSSGFYNKLQQLTVSPYSTVAAWRQQHCRPGPHLHDQLEARLHKLLRLLAQLHTLQLVQRLQQQQGLWLVLVALPALVHCFTSTAPSLSIRQTAVDCKGRPCLCCSCPGAQLLACMMRSASCSTRDAAHLCCDDVAVHLFLVCQHQLIECC